MKALNFNDIQQPTWAVTLRDPDKTTVNLEAPSVELVDRLTALAPELQAVAETKDGRAIRSCYELIAEIMSCNDDGFTFSAEELRDRYKMRFVDIALFVQGYLEFLTEIKNAKN